MGFQFVEMRCEEKSNTITATYRVQILLDINANLLVLFRYLCNKNIAVCV